MTSQSSNNDGLEGPSLAPPPAAVRDVDPELLALPAPPRGLRLLSLALLGAVVIAATALLVQLRADLAYGFAPGRAADIGEATTLDVAGLVPNRYVRIRGAPMLSRMVRYERVLSGEVFAVFPLAGQRQIFVQLPLAALRDPTRIALGEFSGRLLTFGQLGGRLLPVRELLTNVMGLPVTSESFVVLAEQPPRANYGALLLCVMCATISVLASWLIVRWFRPLA